MSIDEIIEDAEKRKAETLLLIDIQRIIGADLPYEAVQLARYIEHREAQTREALAEAEECVGHYADKNRWKSARGGTVRIYQVDSVADTGYDHAVKAQAEIKRLKGEK